MHVFIFCLGMRKVSPELNQNPFNMSALCKMYLQASIGETLKGKRTIIVYFTSYTVVLRKYHFQRSMLLCDSVYSTTVLRGSFAYGNYNFVYMFLIGTARVRRVDYYQD